MSMVAVMTLVMTSMTSVMSVVVEDGWVSGNSLVEDLRLETSLGGRDVVDGPEDTIGLNEAVRSLGHISITDFAGALNITGVLIGNSITVFVSGVGVDIVVVVSVMAVTMMAMSPSETTFPELGASSGNKGQDSNENLHVESFV